MMKKFISITLVFLIACTSCTVFAAETEVDTDIANMQYVDVINELGFAKLTDASEYVTRIDFTEMIARACGNSSLDAVNTAFADVKRDDAKSGYVSWAVDNGYLNGFSDGYFRPYDPITYNQVITCLIRLIGYEPYALIKGGYPYGYIIVADELDITAGVSLHNGDSPVILADLARLLHDALTVELLEIGSISDGSMSYSTNPGKTWLSNKMDIYVIEGQLTGTYLTTLGGSSNLAKNRVTVGNTEYLSSVDLTNDIGKNMSFYIKKIDGGVGEIMTVLPDVDMIDVIIQNENVVSIESNKITYLNENGKKASMRITDDTDCIYNGKAKLSWDISVLNDSEAYIRILDADGNGECDVVFVEKYVNLTIDKVKVEDKAIFFKNSLTYPKINLDEPVRYALYNASGEILDFSELSEGDILSVAISDGSSVYIIRHSTQKISGVIDLISDKYVTISNVEYPYDTTIKNDLKVGTSGSFALDFRGKIVAIADESGDLKYGYLMKMADKSEMVYSAYAKIFTQEGTFNQFEFADRVNVNGTQKDEDEAYALVNAILPTDADSETQKQKKRSNALIRYGVNAEGEINKVELAQDGSTLSESERLSTFSIDEYFETIFYRSSKVLAHRHILNDSTLIFFIPEDHTIEENYQILPLSDILGDTTLRYTSVYDTDENYAVSAMVSTINDKDTIAYNKDSGVITNIIDGINENGEVVRKITLLTRTGEVSTEPVYTDMDVAVYKSDENKANNIASNDPDIRNIDGSKKSSISVNALRKGDVIQYRLNSAGKISNARLFFRGSYPNYYELTDNEKYTSLASADDVNSQVYTCYGTAERVFDGGLSLIVPDSNNTSETYNEFKRVFSIADTFKVVRCNKNRGTFEQITLADIYPGEDVFIHMASSTLKLVVVYN